MIDEHWSAWLASKGISNDTAERFGLRTEGGDLLLPYRGGYKRRTELGGGKRKFSYTSDAGPQLFGVDFRGRNCVLLGEGESDAMLLDQEMRAAGHEVGVCGLPGVSSWHTEWLEDLEDAERIYVILDNDEDYMVQAQVDKAWEKISADLGPRAVRIYLPSDVKDVCDFFKNYELETLVDLLAGAKNGRYHYEPVDWTSPVPEYEWLLEGWIAKGDVVLLMGEPNCGKSFVVLDLALKMAAQDKQWMGIPISGERVLIVDEENPYDVVRNRVASLGCDVRVPEGLRYLHNQNIRLDRSPRKLLDEALAFRPSLIILDSLTRFHSRDENNSGEINRLFKEGIVPLARKSGAAVIVIHHAIKADTNNSFQRTRGSGDINAVVDAGIDMRRTAPGLFTMTAYKGRRNLTGNQIYGVIEDTGDGVRIGAQRGPNF